MPKCKRCNEPAVPYEKRYCTVHLAEYKAKRAEYARIERTLPQCDSGIAPDCTGKISKTRFDVGDTSCLQCQHHQEEADEKWQAAARRLRELRNVDDIDGLKSWIEEYLL